MEENKMLKKKLLMGINGFITIFQSNPYHFLYERDIQCALTSHLRTYVKDEITVPGMKNKPEKYTLNLINTEYFKRIDIVCLQPVLPPDYQFKPYKGFDTYIYGLPIYLGIELKYDMMGKPTSHTALVRDYQKLASHSDRIERKLVLCFFQEDNRLQQLCDETGNEKDVVNFINKLDRIYCIDKNQIVAIAPTETNQ